MPRHGYGTDGNTLYAMIFRPQLGFPPRRSHRVADVPTGARGRPGFFAVFARPLRWVSATSTSTGLVGSVDHGEPDLYQRCAGGLDRRDRILKAPKSQIEQAFRAPHQG